MASKTLVNAVFDFHNKHVFSQVKDYFLFHDYSHKSRDIFNRTLLRNLEKSDARKIESALVLDTDVTRILHLPKTLQHELKIIPLAEAQKKSNQITSQQAKELPGFYILLDYSLNRHFLTTEDYLHAHYQKPEQFLEHQWIEKRIRTAIREKQITDNPVIHIFTDILSEITLPGLTRSQKNIILDQSVKAEEFERFLNNRDLVLCFYGLNTVTGNS